MLKMQVSDSPAQYPLEVAVSSGTDGCTRAVLCVVTCMGEDFHLQSRLSAQISCHNSKNPEAYYAHASSYRYLGAICCPVLLISADDDPITGGVGVGREGLAVMKHGVSVRAGSGGHCAFLKGWAGWGGNWRDDVVTDVAVRFLEAALNL